MGERAVGLVSDEVLFGQLLQGELGAFDLLYDRYERHLFGFVVRLLGDRQEAEDVVHDTFLALLREGKTGVAVTCFRAWVYQVARHLSLNRLRSRQRAARAMQTAARTPEVSPPHPEHALATRQADDALRVALTRLPPALVEVFQLRAGGLSYEEMAQVLEVPLGTIKSRMHDMVHRLREELRA